MNKMLRNRIFAIASIALAARIAYIVLFPGLQYYPGISSAYVEVAQNILAGKGAFIAVDTSRTSSPSEQVSMEPFIDRPLGYVILILIPFSISANPVVAQVFEAILGSASAVILFLIGLKFFSGRTSFLAALLYAIWPISARLETVILPDAVMSFILLSSLWTLLKGCENNKSPWFLCSGLILGAGILMRPDIVFLPIVWLALLLILGNLRQRTVRSILLFGGVALMLGLHTFRNYEVTGGRIIPLGLGNGISMWEGISQFGDTLGTVYGDDRMAAKEGYRSWAYPNGVDRDKKRFAEAIDIIVHHPMWYSRIMLRRVSVLLTLDGILTSKLLPAPKIHFRAHPEDSYLDYFMRYPLGTFIQAILILSQLAIIALSLFAMLKGFENQVAWLLSAVVFYYILIHIPTNTEPRYFYPALPVVLLLASRGLEVLPRFWNKGGQNEAGG